MYAACVHRASQSRADGRSEGRSNVFLTATVHDGAQATPVRIRNISLRGALVDGPELPPVGSRVRLLRGGLSAIGQLAWAGSGQAGVSFERDIDVGEWVKRVEHKGQQRVDRIVAALRGGGEVAGEGEQPSMDSLPAISESLDQLCDQLTKTPALCLDFGEELLKLNDIAQALGRLARRRS